MTYVQLSVENLKHIKSIIEGLKKQYPTERDLWDIESLLPDNRTESLRSIADLGKEFG